MVGRRSGTKNQICPSIFSLATTKFQGPLDGSLAGRGLEIEFFRPLEGVSDKWTWTKERSRIYSVCSAYEVLIGEGVVFPSDPIFGALWRVRAPSNVLALIRKLLLNRVQTKENLLRRGVLLQDEEAKCPFCLTDTESSSHLLFTCRFSWKIWPEVYAWLGYLMALPSKCRSHLQQHMMLRCSKKGRDSCWFIWIATVWIIWHLRNDKVFKDEAPTFSSMLEKVQF